jgi:hypothetical protein
MKRACVFAVLLLVQLVLSSCASRNANIETTKSFRDLCPEKKVSICSSEIPIGAMGLAFSPSQIDEALEYKQKLTSEFHHIYEEGLRKSGFFQLSPSKKLHLREDGRPLSMDELARENNLYACVNVKAKMGVRPGLKKYVQLLTDWEITKSSGEKITFKTQVISEETAGVFVNTASPELEPVFLELARQSAQQFLTALGEESENGSCLKDSLEREKAALKKKDDSRFINKGNEAVLDTKTGLMWAAKDNGSDIKWADAKSYCENYRVGGYTDWRMPTSAELEGLYDARKESPAACNKSYSIHVATGLINVTCYYLWASETRERFGLISDAAYFYFMYGGQYWARQSASETYRVLPVHTGK